jgi:hypothetical protein
MSDPNEEHAPDPTPLTPISRRKTFDTGTTTVSAPAAAKSRLRTITRGKIIVRHGTYKYKKLAFNDEIRILRILKGN